MLKKFRFTIWDKLELELYKETEAKLLATKGENKKVIPKRFNLGFGIIGVPEQCKNGKYCNYTDLVDLETYWRRKENKMVKDYLEDRQQFDSYIRFKETRIEILFLLLVVLLISNIIF